MKTFNAPTEDFVRLARTTLSSDAAAGSSVALTVDNNNGIAQDAYVVIGTEGSEKAEIQRVSAAVTPGTGITVATLTHKAGETVTVFRYNQRKFYGSLTVDGSYTEITAAGSPKTIGVDNPQGTMFEYSGNEGYAWFKSTYFNSTESIETDIADSVAVPGDQSGRYSTIYAIRKHAGLAGNPFYSDERIEAKRKQAENEIDSVLYSKYTLPLAEVPAILNNVCELLAAGYLDYEEFGGDGEGVKWLGSARGILKSIQEETQRLIGSDGQELATKELASAVQSYPDTVNNDDGPSQKFSMRQVF